MTFYFSDSRNCYYGNNYRPTPIITNRQGDQQNNIHSSNLLLQTTIGLIKAIGTAILIYPVQTLIHEHGHCTIAKLLFTKASVYFNPFETSSYCAHSLLLSPMGQLFGDKYSSIAVTAGGPVVEAIFLLGCTTFTNSPTLSIGANLASVLPTLVAIAGPWVLDNDSNSDVMKLYSFNPLLCYSVSLLWIMTFMSILKNKHINKS